VFSLETGSSFGPLPTGLSLDPTTGLISGTPLASDETVQYEPDLPAGEARFGICVAGATQSRCFGPATIQILATAPTTTTTTEPTTTTTVGKNVVIENFSGNFTYSEVPFTTTVPETLVWAWTNTNGDYASGFLLYNSYTDQTLVSFDVHATNTPNALPGGNGSITIPPGTYWLDITDVGPWTIAIS